MGVSVRVGAHISIHAPVKGATDLVAVVGGRDGISIHAPVKGATSRIPVVLAMCI